MTATDKPARRTVSAEEKAREALGVAERKVKRATDARTKAVEKRAALIARHDDAIRPLDVVIAQLGMEVAEADREVAAWQAMVESLAPAGDPLHNTPRNPNTERRPIQANERVG